MPRIKLAKERIKRRFDNSSFFIRSTDRPGKRYENLTESNLKVWAPFAGSLSYTSQDSTISTPFEEPLGGSLTFVNDSPLKTDFFADLKTSLSTDNSSTSAQIAYTTEERDVISGKPFTLMFWMKASATGYQQVASMGGSNVALGVNGTTVVGGTATIRFTADFSGTDGIFISEISDILSTCQNSWIHICVSYDPRSTSNVPRMYINGQRIDVNVNTSPVGGGMLIVSSLNVGSDAASGTTRFNNLMFFDSIVTRDEDVEAIYNAVAGKAYRFGSGILSNPARILLQERDNKTGSYPTIARTGDSDFTGQFASTFDDTKIINFTPGNLIFPSVLPESSIWVSGGIATPNILQGLAVVGTASKGVSDSHVNFTPGENISPFNESRIYIDNDSSFYNTGSSSSVLPGFEQRLSSKTIISFDINPKTSTNIFFSTGSAKTSYSSSEVGYASGVNSGLVYFNWQRKIWEPIGNFITGSNVDFLNPDPAIRSNAIHIAVGQQQNVIGTPQSVIARHVGRFHSTYGFPFATQYNSTGSQEFHLTGTLSGPFLLEKAVLEWSASFPSTSGSTSDGPLCYQFFLLNVSPISDSVSIVQDLTGSATGAEPFTTRNSVFNVTQVKDLIWSGEISRTNPLYVTSPYQRDLTIATSDATTGTFRVESAATSYNRNDGLLTHALRDSDILPLVANKIGFRNFGGFVEGKSFVKPIASITPSGSVSANGGVNDYTITAISDIKTSSPYVLLPHHKLVLGFYGAPLQGTFSFESSPYSEAYAKNHVVTLSPGAGKLTLYGSMLQNNLPVESETNQPLTSDSIHEDIHYDNPVYDQFDVEPFETFRGSYVDHIITGSMVALVRDVTTNKLIVSGVHDERAGVRKIQALVTSGQAGTTGSLQRFVNLVDGSFRSYDSFPPDFGGYISSLGKGYFAASPSASLKGSSVILSTPTSTALTSGNPRSLIRDWYQTFPFVNGSIERMIGANTISNKSLPAYNLSDVLQSRTSVYLVNFSKTLTVDTVAGAQSNVSDINGIDDILSSYKAIWGFGKNEFYSPDFVAVGVSVTPKIRGYKYGLGGLLGSSADARFRRDRFGQFRDMLEQRKDTAFVTAKGVDYPVIVSFFSRPDPETGISPGVVDPIETHSQNLSKFSTSSLPFFDADRPILQDQRAGTTGIGNGRDRTDYPDFWVLPVSIK